MTMVEKETAMRALLDTLVTAAVARQAPGAGPQDEYAYRITHGRVLMFLLASPAAK